MTQAAFPLPHALIAALRTAQQVVVLTGAGVSAESGIPTFRDAQVGLWEQYRPEELATPEAFARQPRLVWEWYAWRRSLVEQATPNPGHLALAEMERRIPHMTLVTQNVDGLHQRAGSQRVLELHGNISRIRCSQEEIIIQTWEETDEVPPRCPRCGSFLRPDVVWFGETLPQDALEAAAEATLHCDLFFSIGTSGLVQPAASLPLVAHRRGTPVFIINPDEEAQWPADYGVIKGASASVLPSLLKMTWG